MQQFVEIPANKMSLSKRRPLFGVGINDASYMVQPNIDGNNLVCPYYSSWQNMITRSYSKRFQSSRVSYIGCTVAEEWLKFSTFRKWMETQDWQGKQLDKDILVPGNKIYGPDTCIFVSHAINSLLLDSAASRGGLPQGVSYHNTGRYQAKCNIKGKQNHIGYFSTASGAAYAYCIFKARLIREVALESESSASHHLQKALLNHAELLEIKGLEISASAGWPCCAP